MPMKRADRQRALELLASCPDGCPEALLTAHGFTGKQMVDLVGSGLATTTEERVIAGKSRWTLRACASRTQDDGRLAITSVLAEAVAISPDELAVETARRFGFDRTGQDLKQEIDRQVKALMKAGKIVFDGEAIRAATTSIN
jgi:hypothetical protein